MKEAAKFFVVFCIIMVTFGLPILLQSVLNNGNPKTGTQTPTPTEVAQVDDVRFISVPPVIVAAKSTFIYKVLATSLSGQTISFSVLSKPDWMSWQEDKQQLTGTVPATGGVFSVTVRATSPAGDAQDQAFTVTIDTQEQSVKGAKTVAMWKDPFHPNVEVTEIVEQPNEEQKSALLPATSESATQVLGEKTVNTNLVTTAKDAVALYTTWILVGVLAILILVVLVKIVITAMNNPARRLPQGIVIERGGR